MDKGVLQLLSYSVFLSGFLLMLSFPGFEVSRKMSGEKMDRVQEERKRVMKEMCASDRKAFLEDPMKENKLRNLIVDDEHGLIYCYVPKVACTNWKKFMFVLKQGEPYSDPNNVIEDVHQPKVLTYLWDLPKEEIEVKLKHYTKFMFVRDPFVRVISAYRNKFEWPGESFYVRYGRDILRRFGNLPYPPQTAEEVVASDIHITFRNFVQYLIDPRTEEKAAFEIHWRQMYRLCQPCLIEYDFIGHMETLNEDTEHLLRVLKLQDNIRIPPSFPNVTSVEVVKNWFNSVPLEERQKLYELYEGDFKLFGYKKPEELFHSGDKL